MTLADLSDISQALGAVAVVASLLFVGVQVRQNTAMSRATSHHAVSDALNQINFLWAENADASRIFLAGMDNRKALTAEDRWRFDATCRGYLHICETMHTQAELGVGDQSLVAAEQPAIRMVLGSPGGSEWWAENTFGFCPAFRDYVDRLTETSRSI